MEQTELDTRIARALEAVEGVRVAYLFGSQVTGRARPDSDLDVAVSFRAGLDETARLQARLDVIATLTDELGPLGERADVVDLDRASSAVGFRAIRDGRCLVERSRADRVRLEARIARRYDDDAPRRQLIRTAAARAGRQLEVESRGRS